MAKKINNLPGSFITQLNNRLNDEYNAERFYISASMWCDNNGFSKASKFFVDRYHEERRHAHRIQKEITNWGAIPQLPAIAKTDTAFSSLLDIVKQAYDMEFQIFTDYQESIKAVEEEFPAGEIFFEWFVKAQNCMVVHMAGALKVIDGVNDKAALIMLSKEVFKRK